MRPKDNAYAYPRVAKKGTVTNIKKQLNKIEGEVGMAIQNRYTNKGSWDNKVHVTSLLLFTEMSLAVGM